MSAATCTGCAHHIPESQPPLCVHHLARERNHGFPVELITRRDARPSWCPVGTEEKR